VRRRCEPVVTGFEFAGALSASPSPGFASLMPLDHAARHRDLPVKPVSQHRADPCGAGVRDWLLQRGSLCRGLAADRRQALKGPGCQMIDGVGLQATPQAIANAYHDLIDGLSDRPRCEGSLRLAM